MEKTKQSVKKMLKEHYEKACESYIAVLMRMWELDPVYGYWNSDEPGTIYPYGETPNLTMEDIIYCVENDIKEDEVLEWEDYLLDAHEFGFNTPNLRSWHIGCPRTEQSVFEHLRQLKMDLQNAIDEEKERIEKENKS